MLDFRGFSAWITSDGLELVEFESRVKDNTVTCWVAGTANKTFIVHWRDHGSQVDSASYITIDGHTVSGQFLYGSGEELRRGVRVGPDEERPFVFSSIQADDKRGFDGKPAHKNIGSIVLDIRLVKRCDSRDPDKFRDPPEVIRGYRQEGDVAVRYGSARATSMQQRTWVLKPFNPKAPGAHVSFVFRYRSQDWLISQGIIDPDEAIHASGSSHPHFKQLSKAELPPDLLAEYRRRQAETTPPERRQTEVVKKEDPAPSDLQPRVAALNALGVGPLPGSSSSSTSRNSSNNTIRSFSGTWDPHPTTTHFEEWSEYVPDDIDYDF